MRVFVTGATGFVGSAVVDDLLAAGHKVLALVRSEAAAATLAALGVDILHASLEEPERLAQAAATCDGVIHTAFNHDFSRYAQNAVTERHAVEAMGAALAGSARPLIGTTGVGLLAPGRVGTEDDMADPASHGSPRLPMEVMTLGLAARGVRSSIVRLSPTVHGDGDHGFVPWLIRIARERGVSAYIGDGQNRWPAVHRLDAARVYRLALEQGTAGTCYHAVAEEGVPTRLIAEVIGRRLGLPVVARSREEAQEHFGFLAYFFGADIPASSAKTRASLGWMPEGPGLIEDLDRNVYFPSVVA
ncbi:SDR family oxidoreductase [Dyella sp. 2RAB6]|uniref:SDR family oxidoreductase n=1 Tax=Dyella sp. 2RAB6 TaxID=3232992 RepID=UPI003F901503